MPTGIRNARETIIIKNAMETSKSRKAKAMIGPR